jgi:hypothetical protein
VALTTDACFADVAEDDVDVTLKLRGKDRVKCRFIAAEQQ